MNFCPNCGRKRNGENFCPNCGYKFPTGESLESYNNDISNLETAFSIAVKQKQQEENEKIEQERLEKERIEKEYQEKLANRFKIYGVILERYNGDEEVVVIPEGVEYIGINSFQYNKTAKKVILPKSLKRIETYAFF